jgi:integrase
MAIVKRGDKYGVRVWVDGRHRWLGTFATRTEARRAEADATIQPVSGSAMTVEQWARIWLQRYARPAAATQRTYRYAIEQVIRDIGSLGFAGGERPPARAGAHEWPRNTTRTARTMWGDALRDGVCQHNPFTNLRLETPKGRKDLIALTEAEIDRLATAARETHGDYGDEMAAIVLFAAYTGVRPGELGALRWADLDPANRQAVISRALDGQGGEKPPKNGLARPIILPPRALEALGMVTRHRDSPWVFHSPRGKRLSKGNLNYLWRPVAAAWRARGGRDVDLYELRHACATLLLERGLTPADVAVQLGHTDGGRLVQILYGHPDEERALDRLQMAFAADGHNSAVEVTQLGQDPAANE